MSGGMEGASKLDANGTSVGVGTAAEAAVRARFGVGVPGSPIAAIVSRDDAVADSFLVVAIDGVGVSLAGANCPEGAITRPGNAA